MAMTVVLEVVACQQRPPNSTIDVVWLCGLNTDTQTPNCQCLPVSAEVES